MSRKRLAAQKGLTSLIAIAVAIQPIATAYAQVAPDINAPTSQRPVIDRAANGTPVVDITTPNANGVSHNIYQVFNVPQNGLILNNSSALYQSQLAGLILGNPRITSGNEAKLIINEVSGIDRSLLAGYMEVAGKRAAVIVANPNGITCDGCGFVNMSRAVLTTGRPSFDAAGNLLGFSVTGGDVLVQGAGMDASRIDRLDLVARAVEINAALHAKDFNLSGGRQNYNYGTGIGSAIAGDGSAKPVFYLDSSALGGIYGERIRIVGTEAGLGIRAPGNMAASVGDMELLADGRLILRNASAATGLTATSTSGDVEIEGAAYSDAGVNIRAAGTLRLDDNAVLGTKSTLLVNAQALNIGKAVVAAGLNADGTIAASGGTATINIAGPSVIAAGGLLHGGDHLQFVAGGDFVNAGTVQGNGLLSITAQGKFENSGLVSSASDISIATASSLTNTAKGQFAAGRDLALSSATLLNLAGSVRSNRDATFIAPVAQTTDVSVARDAHFTFDSFTHHGTIAIGGTGTFAITGNAALDANAVIGSVGALTFTLGQLDNSGTIVTNAGLDIHGQSSTAGILSNTASGRIVGGTAANIKFFDVQNSGLLTSNGNLTINGHSLTNLGQITAADTLTLTEDSAENRGTISASTLNATISNFTNRNAANFQAIHALTLQADTLLNQGQMVSTGTQTLRAGALTNDGGAIIAQDALTIGGQVSGSNASLITLVNGQIASAGSTVTLNANDLSVAGTLSANTDLIINASHNATLLASGSLQAGRDLMVNAVNQIDAQGSVRANQDVRFSGSVIRTSDVGAGRDILFSGGSYSNQGTLTAVNDATLRFTTSIANLQGHTLSAGHRLTIAAPLSTNDGILASDGEVLLTGGTSGGNLGAHMNTATGKIAARFVSSMDLGSFTNAGTVFASDLVNLSGGTLLNQNEISGDGGVGLAFTTLTNNGLINGSDVALSASGGIENRAVIVGGQSTGGVVQASQSLSIVAPTIVNSELIASGGTLRVGASNFTNSEGLVIARGDLTLDGLTAGTRATLIHNDAGTFESTQGNVTIRAGTLENFGNGLVEHRINEIRHQYITGHHPPAGLAFYSDLISGAGYNQLYDGGRTAEYVWVPSPEQVDIILAAEGITIDQWTPTLWQKYAPDPSNFDPTKWAIYVPDEASHAPIGSYILARDDRDVITKPNTPGQILTDHGNVFIDAGLLHNKQSTISAVGDMVLTGGSVINEGLTLNDAYTLTSSYNNDTLRGEGWSRSNGVGLTQWIPHHGGTILVRSENIGTINSTIAATGTLSGNLAGSFVNVGAPATDPDTLSFAHTVSGIITVANPGGAGAAPAASLSGTTGGGAGATGGTGGSISNVATISNSQLKAFAPAIDTSRFVIETRLPFINLADYFGSDYFFDRLGLRPDSEIKLLGDAYFDTTIIRAQILDLTGKRFLDPSAASDANQVKILLDNGVALSKRLNLKPGVGLTAEQQGQLTDDVVLYVAQEFRGKTVLVPQLYLAPGTLNDLGGKAARTSANVINIASAIFLNDNGEISGTNSLTVKAGDIYSVGGRNVGGRVTLAGTNSIDLRTDTRTTGNGDTLQGAQVGARTVIQAQNLNLVAPQINLEGVQIHAADNLDITAKNLNIGPTEVFARSAYASKKLSYDNSNNLLLLSDLSAGNNISINASDTAFIRAATLKAGNDVLIHAGQLFITSGQQQSSSSGKMVKHGFTDSTRTWDSIVVTQIPTIIDAGNAIQIQTTIGDTAITASILKADKIGIQSAGQIRIESAANIDNYSTSKTSSNLLVQSIGDAGRAGTTQVQTQLDAPLVTLQADKGIVIQFRSTGDLDQSIADLAQFPGFAYLKDVKGQSGVDFQAVKDQYRSWSHSQSGLSGPAATLIIMAIVAATGQLELLGTTTTVGGVTTTTLFGSQIAATAANAGFSALVTHAGHSLLTNGGDFGATLRELGSAESFRAFATAIVTAGILEGINQYGEVSAAGETTQQFSDKVIQRLRDIVVKSTVTAGVDTAINGGSFSRNLVDSLKYNAVATIGADAAFEIGCAAHGGPGCNLTPSELAEGSKIGTLAKYIAHAALGCALGAADGDCKSGAIGAVIGEATASQITDELTERLRDGKISVPQLDEWRAKGADLARLSGALAAALAGSDAKGITLAGNAAQNAAYNNNDLILLGVGIVAEVALEEAAMAGIVEGGAEATGLAVRWCTTNPVCRTRVAVKLAERGFNQSAGDILLNENGSEQGKGNATTSTSGGGVTGGAMPPDDDENQAAKYKVDRSNSTAKTENGQSPTPRDSAEARLFEEVEQNPADGKKLDLNNDPKFLRSDGWQKMQKSIKGPDGNSVTIHWQFNANSGTISDMKIVTPKR